MVTIGNLSVLIAFIVSVWTCAAILVGLMRNDVTFIESGRRSIHAMAVITSMAAFSLTYVFVTSNFHGEYVASFSDRALPIFYKLNRFWASQKC